MIAATTILATAPIGIANNGPPIEAARLTSSAPILDAAYRMMAVGTCYQDRGHPRFARRAPARAAKKRADRIHNPGYNVDIRAAA